MGAETDYTTNRVKTVSVAVNTATVSQGRTPAAAAAITETPSRQEHFNWCGGKCLKLNNLFFPENNGMECQRSFLEKKTSTTRLSKAFSFPVHLSALLHFSQRETYHTCARVDVKIDMSEQIIYNILSIISQVSNLCEIFIVLC